MGRGGKYLCPLTEYDIRIQVHNNNNNINRNFFIQVANSPSTLRFEANLS